ncbi:LLM class flavin-dependent oxidoreductase [Pseudokineococcus sp. 1T1Z-3]|uniref:LLM class flavin-dependent oxidoreductase n=1 Tax=Pseudokineococcus sp. 1T1Z-3 TaxID=3132745 RepID=UPI00309D74A3
MTGDPVGGQKHLRINAFLYACGHHVAAWRQPGSPADRLGDVTYWEELARTAERGGLDAVFLADGHAVGPVQHGPTWVLEPLTTLAAMARATSTVGLVTTVSTTFFAPFAIARALASLDHLSGGRVGWNVVTSMTDAEARNHGLAAMPPSAERYARADDVVRAVLALWDSWDDDAVEVDREGRWADPEAVHAVDHDGPFVRTAGPLTVPRSPQGRPVLFQAGASEAGLDLAARYADGVYAVAHDAETSRAHAREVRRRAAAAGRDPASVAVMPGLVAFVGSSEEEARRHRAALDALLPVEHSLAQLGGFVGQDTSAWDVDAPVPDLPPAESFTGPQGRYRTILRILAAERSADGGRLRVRELLGRLAAGGGHATVLGTPEQVADELEHWFRTGAADGVNLMPPSLPGDLETFCEHVVPELRRRGLVAPEPAGTTLREHLGLARPAPVRG